jgi:hypothetical protein
MPSQDLTTSVLSALGIVPHSKAQQQTAGCGWAPPRPAPVYDWIVYFSRPEYGTAIVCAGSQHEAVEEAYGAEVDWDDYGDSEISDVEKQQQTPENQDDLDSWDDTYASKYAPNGAPSCSNCLVAFDSSDSLVPSPDGAEWFCEDCEPDY